MENYLLAEKIKKWEKWKEEESIFKGVDLIRCKIHNWTSLFSLIRVLKIYPFCPPSRFLMSKNNNASHYAISHSQPKKKSLPSSSKQRVYINIYIHVYHMVMVTIHKIEISDGILDFIHVNIIYINIYILNNIM